MLERHDRDQVIGMALLHDIIQAAINSLRHQQLFLNGGAAWNELHGRTKQLDKEGSRIHSTIVSLSRAASEELDLGGLDHSVQFDGDYCEHKCSDLPAGQHHPSCVVYLLSIWG